MAAGAGGSARFVKPHSPWTQKSPEALIASGLLYFHGLPWTLICRGELKNHYKLMIFNS